MTPTTPPDVLRPAAEGVDCRHFNGYKPCFPGVDCVDGCSRHEPMGTRILIINLDAMGDVLMTTAQLPAIRRTWPVAHVSWITHPAATALLAHNPLIDRVYGFTDENRMILAAQRFDVVLNADKSTPACAFARMLQTDDLRGFTLSDRGQIISANPGAMYNYRLGLDDHLKFRVNTRTGQDILAETWDLPYARDPYTLVLTGDELAFVAERRAAWGLEGRTVIGFNTGCSELFPNKKMHVEQQARLAVRLARLPDTAIMLLGGREDTERNAAIAALCRAEGVEVIETPTTEGLRRGICYESLADVVITGDSFGMHLAIALGKHVLAWFGLSCQAEIDLYDRGAKFFDPDLACAPCWKRVCPHNLECITGIDLDGIARAAEAFVAARTTVSAETA